MTIDPALLALVDSLRRERFPAADCVLLCGSIVRGEGTATSDLDLVVLFPHVEAAWRESFHYMGREGGAGWPVECFCHDLETAEYYFTALDRPSATGGLTHMVLEGVAVPGDTALSRRLVARAQANFDAGPPVWTPAERDYSRYSISGLMDDLRGATAHAERCAIATVLYALLSQNWFRQRGLWVAHGKLIVRRMRRVDAAFATRFELAFADLFAGDRLERLLALCAEVLAPEGGPLFAGFDPPRDPAQRMPVPEDGAGA